MNLNSSFHQSQLQQYFDSLKVKQTSSATIERKISSLNSFQNFLIKKGYLKPNPNPTLSLDRAEGFKNTFLSRYLIFGTLIAIILGLGYGLYTQTILKAKQELAYSTATAPIRAGRVLSFQGRLTDTSGNPISSPTDIVFKFYNGGVGGTELYNSGIGPTIIPDENGIFSVVIGKSHGTEIPSSVFSENPDVWLEITADSETMDPRQQIATVAYAVNAETLQGMPPSASGIKNTVLVIGASGNIMLGETSPSIISTSGTFGIEGQAVLIKASDGSGGNITINPDGNGTIRFLTEGTSPNIGGFADFSNNNIAGGNLINSQINNTSRGYNFLSFQNYNTGTSNPSTRFSVGASGNVYISNSLNAGGTITFTGLPTGTGSTVVYINSSGNLVSGTLPASTSYTADNGLHLSGSIFGLGGTLTDTNFTNINIGAGSSGLAILGLNNNTQALVILQNGNVGIGTTNPLTTLHISGSGEKELRITSSNGEAFFSIDRGSLASRALAVLKSSTINKAAFGLIGNSDDFVFITGSALASDERMRITAGGNVGIGTTSPTQKFQVNSIGTSVFVITANGSVGIGTTSPAYKLQVIGNVNVSTSLTVGTSLSVGSTTYTGSLNINNATAVGGSYVVAYVGTGTTGFIGYLDTTSWDKNAADDAWALAASLGTAQVISAGNTASFIGFNGIGTSISGTDQLSIGLGGTLTQNTIINTSSYNLSFLGLGNTQSLYISSTGYVGVGTTSPTYKLELAGSGSLFRIADSSNNTLVDITDVNAEFNLPTTFTSTGDVSMANNLNFTNSLASYINSAAPLYLQAGESFNSSDLTLRTYNAGQVIVDSSALNVGGTFILSQGASNGYILQTDASGNSTWITPNSLGIGTTYAAGVGLTLSDTNIFALDLASTNTWTGVQTFQNNFAVGSSALITNLNANYLNGIPSTGFLQVGGTGFFNTATNGLQAIGNTGIGLGGTLTQTNFTNINIGAGSSGLAILGLNNNTQALVILQNGNVGIGTTEPTRTLTIAGRSGFNPFQIQDTLGNNVFDMNIYGNITINRRTASGTSSGITWQKDRDGGALQNNDELGLLRWMGYDGIAYRNTAMIFTQVDGTPSGTGVPSRMTFLTGDGLNSGYTERMRINSSGNVGIGTATPTQKLDVNGSVNIGGSLAIGSIGSTTDNNRVLTSSADGSGIVQHLDTTSWDKSTADDYTYWTANVGTSNLNVGSTSTLTFATGTGLSASLIGNTLTLTNTSLGTTYAAGVGLTLSDTNVFSLDLASTNTWTGVQTFQNNFAVGSSALITDLNANYLNGIPSTGFLQVGGTGFFNTATNGLQAIGSTAVGLGGTLTQATIINTDSYSLSFLGLGGTQSLFIGSSGYVGIGTTAPTSQLYIYNESGSGSAAFIIDKAGKGNGFNLSNMELSTTISNGKAFSILAIGEAYARTQFYSDGSYGIGGGAANRDVYISRLSANNLLISSNRTTTGAANLLVVGNVGIGFTSPSQKLNVKVSGVNAVAIVLIVGHSGFVEIPGIS